MQRRQYILSRHTLRANIVEVSTYSTHLFGNISGLWACTWKSPKINRGWSFGLYNYPTFYLCGKQWIQDPLFFPSAIVLEPQNLDAQHRSQNGEGLWRFVVSCNDLSIFFPESHWKGEEKGNVWSSHVFSWTKLEESPVPMRFWQPMKKLNP